MADSFTPDAGQRVDAAGNVTYDFEGHIAAQGVDLKAGTSTAPPNDRRIRWLHEADGSVVAEIYGYSRGGIRQDALHLHAPDRLSATTDGGPVELISNDTRLIVDQASGVRAEAGFQPLRATVRHPNGGSSFVMGNQEFNVTELMRIRGPFSEPFAVLAGGVAVIDAVVQLDKPLEQHLHWQPLGSLYNAVGFADFCTWAYRYLSGSSVRFFIANHHPTATADGDLNFCMLTID